MPVEKPLPLPQIQQQLQIAQATNHIPSIILGAPIPSTLDTTAFYSLQASRAETGPQRNDAPLRQP